MRASAERSDEEPTTRAARLWAASGAMALTGRADAAPSVAPAALAIAAERAALRVCDEGARRGVALALDGPALLGERAACAGLARRGRVSAGGAARLLRAADGWLAVNFPRDADRAALAAWLERDVACAPLAWDAVAHALATERAVHWVERARLLGLAVAEAAALAAEPPAPLRVLRCGTRAATAPRAPCVVDLSSLWAGPLCTSLLAAAGACVWKVESTRRPDGARGGPPAFFDLLHADKASVALDFATREGVAALGALLDAADVVVESARPRALRQLGFDAEAWVAARPGRIWVAITGYGRAAPRDAWVAFGDDAAAAAGLAVLAGRDDDGPLFCADAVADPLAGLTAAGETLAQLRGGGGVLIDVALRDVAAHAAHAAPAPARWRGCVAAPRARRPHGAARPFGADTCAVLASLAPVGRVHLHCGRNVG